MNFEVNAKEFLTALKRTKHCICENESHRSLMGVNLSVTAEKPEILRVTTGDMYRIARQEIEIESVEPFSVTIAGYELEKIKRITAHSGTTIAISVKNMFLYVGAISTVKLLDVEYPALDRLINNAPSDRNVIKIPDVKRLYKGLDFLCDDPKTVLKLGVFSDMLSLVNQDLYANVELCIGEGHTYQDCIGLNVRFFRDAIQVFKIGKAKTVTLSYADSESPCLLNSDLPGFTQIILPVKLK